MDLFDTNRRGFLVGLTGALIGISSAANLIIPSAALADPKIGRYAMAVKLQRDLIDHTNNMRIVAREYETQNMILYPAAPLRLRGHPCPLVKDELWPQFMTQSDDLFKFLVDNFPARDTPKVRMQLRALFSGTLVADTMSEEGLMALLESVVPVAVAMNLLKTHRLPMQTSVMPNFGRFANNFSDLIFDNHNLPENS